MPEFLEDPSVLTKDKLKSELVANNVTLPAGEQRKDVYVQLYLQHLTARNRPPLAAGANSKGPPDFSSDEEREPTPVLGSGASAGRGRASVGRKATKKTDKPRVEDKDDLDVTELSNEDLLDQLVKYGVNPGPIVGTTRKLYEKKLLKLREQGTESRSSTPLPTVSSSENTRQNGSNDSDRYSDNDEGKKKEHKKVKSTRDFVFSELASTPSGGFFQGISFPEISTRPPLGRTEAQAAKKVHASKGAPPREPLTDTALPGKGQAQKLAPGRNLCIPSESSYDRCVEKSSSPSSQHELTARLASAAASPSLMRETTTTYCKDTVENIYRGRRSRTQPSCTEGPDVSDQSVLSSEREVLQESERSQVISPPLAQAIRDYINSLLVQGGVGSLPGTSKSLPTLDIENICKRLSQSDHQEFESLSPSRKVHRLSKKPVKEGDSGSCMAFQSIPGSEHMSSFGKSVVSHCLNTLGIEVPKQPQHDQIDTSELSFPLHESILKVIEEEWQQIDKQLPPLACKYPVSSSKATQILSVPKVDEEILELIPGATPQAAIRASSTESCDKHLDLALCRSYEAAASALQIAAHMAFVAKSLQANISQAAQVINSDPSHAHQALEILNRTYDAASYLCDAAFDEARMSARTMGSSTMGRRCLWLKDCKINAASKTKLTAAPFKGGTLFGGEVPQVIKKHRNK
ncbi:thymopoietin isoform X1 [Meriones unguiculatus]|uniref:thymopoietin isoform X1 n=1 Tax=Meriones unguiculatus TaxID=10047 RepID=UPI00293F4FC1|nr:thymopoietin isoform X1 [Meriones unguiculatus]